MQQVKLSELSQAEVSLFDQAKSAAEKYLNKETTRHVGAALLCKDGTVYQGASIRRSNVSSSTWAERMALDKAIFDKQYEYVALAIIGFFQESKSSEIISPCGQCRQILLEAESYGRNKQHFTIYIASSDLSNIIKTDIGELYPMPYVGRDK